LRQRRSRSVGTVIRSTMASAGPRSRPVSAQRAFLICRRNSLRVQRLASASRSQNSCFSSGSDATSAWCWKLSLSRRRYKGTRAEVLPGVVELEVAVPRSPSRLASSPARSKTACWRSRSASAWRCCSC
jgi:hypothetical protein